MEVIISGNWIDYNFEVHNGQHVKKAMVCLFGGSENETVYSSVCVDGDQVREYLGTYCVLSVPWKIKLDDEGEIVSSSPLTIESQLQDAGVAAEDMFRKGIDASNNDNYTEAASWQ
jgi:hypothetical protein